MQQWEYAEQQSGVTTDTKVSSDTTPTELPPRLAPSSTNPEAPREVQQLDDFLQRFVSMMWATS